MCPECDKMPHRLSLHLKNVEDTSIYRVFKNQCNFFANQLHPVAQRQEILSLK